jgi:hypothetical protein
VTGERTPNDDKWLEKTEAFDVARTGLVTAIDLAMQTGGLPFGGAVATVLAKLIPERKQQRLTMFVEDLGHRIEDVESKVDHDFVRSSEFERAFDRVQSRENEEKISYWAALVVGLAQVQRPPKSDRDRLIDTLDRLRTSHLRLLHVIATSGEPEDESGLTSSSADTIRRRMPDIEADDARRDWNDLQREDIVGNFPSGMMTPRGAANLAAHLTPYGNRLVGLLHLASTQPKPE